MNKLRLSDNAKFRYLWANEHYLETQKGNFIWSDLRGFVVNGINKSLFGKIGFIRPCKISYDQYMEENYKDPYETGIMVEQPFDGIDTIKNRCGDGVRIISEKVWAMYQVLVLDE